MSVNVFDLINIRGIWGASAQGGARFHTSVAEGGRKNPISVPKASKFRKKLGFLSKKRPFLTKKGKLWHSGFTLNRRKHAKYLTHIGGGLGST